VAELGIEIPSERMLAGWIDEAGGRPPRQNGLRAEKMTIRASQLPKDPYLGYDAQEVARAAGACLHCKPPVPCTLACPRQTDIPRVMGLAGQAACEGLNLTRWFLDRERVEAARISDLISDAYN
jgi:hypothetical protein